MLQRLGDVRKLANDPNSITLGLAYGSDFDETLAAIDGKEEAYNQKLEREEAKAVETAVTLFRAAQLDPNVNPADLKQQRGIVMDMLLQAGRTGNKEALRLRAELETEPPNLDYTLYRQYKEGIGQGKLPTDAQIDNDVAAGKLTVEMGRELKVFGTADQQAAFYKQNAKAIEDDVISGLKERGAVSFNPYNNDPTKNAQQTRQVVNDLTQQAFAWYQSQIKAGKTPTDNDINQFTINRLPQVIGTYFNQNPDTKEWTARPVSRNPELTPDRINSALGGYVPNAAGFNPRTIQLRNLNSGSARLLSAEEVTESVERL
jgi:hypothetical protein